MVAAMHRQMSLLRDFARDERGNVAIEYGLILALVSLGIIAATTQLGQSVSGFFQSLASRFPT